MTANVFRRLMLVGVVLAFVPLSGYAQEATVSGTVTDLTGAVLPGVTVTAVHEASGNTFQTVSDGAGAYRLAVRVGVFRLTAELPGFTTLTRTGLELLVGQQAVLNFQLSPATLAETVTVTGEAPLIDVTRSQLGGNIDPRQMQDLPVNGRNWQDLVILAPGNRANAVNEAPVSGTGLQGAGTFQLNVDGQQVTNIVSATGIFGQPRYSRDAVAEMAVISNRFDATQGRSSGLQVNAITKSGTNTPSGTFSGYFRHKRLNAADPVVGRVLPYSDQQLSVTAGGPIRKDKVHIFGNYEYEREPQTSSFTTPYPAFNVDLTGTRLEHKGLVRLDTQFSPRTRLSVRGSSWSNLIPYDGAGGAITAPSTAQLYDRQMYQLFGTLSRVLGSRMVNEVKGGYGGYYWYRRPYVQWANHPQRATFGDYGSTLINFRGFTAGSGATIPQTVGQETYSLRDDFSVSVTKGGRHDVKLGAEFIHTTHWLYLCNSCVGVLDAQAGAIPANIQELFPNQFDASTWNLAALSPIVRRYTRGIGNFNEHAPRQYYAGWLQDDWTITPRLTLNLGLRYDLVVDAYVNWVALPPFLEANRPNDTNDWGPRLGLVYSLNDRTALRGGFGKYFAEVNGIATAWTLRYTHQVVVEALNDGRPDFAANPFNGPGPQTYEEALQFVRARGLRRDASNLVIPEAETPYSYQASVGVQRQLGPTTAFEADYVYTGSRAETFARNINLTYDPVTGVNYPFTDFSRRPYPDWGVVTQFRPESYSNYHGLQTAFTKRLSQGWQASGTYTLSVLRDGTESPAPFPVAPDLGGEYSLAATDQRHRAVFSGLWQLRYGLQLSGLYFFGSGERLATLWGGDFRLVGAGGSGRLRPNGTIVPRNNFAGKPIHRVDLRVQRRFALGGRVGVDGILEVFNLFDHANYGSYTTAESSPAYGRPTRNLNVAYQPRMLQLGFRFAF